MMRHRRVIITRLPRSRLCFAYVDDKRISSGLPSSRPDVISVGVNLCQPQVARARPVEMIHLVTLEIRLESLCEINGLFE